MLPQLDESSPAGGHDLLGQVEDDRVGRACEPDGHLAHLVSIPRIDRIEQFSVVLAGLQEGEVRGLSELLWAWALGVPPEAGKKTRGVVEGPHRTPSAEDLREVRTVREDLLPGLIWSELENRDQDMLAQLDADVGTLSVDHDKQVEVRELPGGSHGHRPVDAHRDEVAALLRAEFAGELLRDREAGDHGVAKQGERP